MALTIATPRGRRHFTIEVAATPEQQALGMMFRRSVSLNRGMIFPYDPPQDVIFWMKNTLIPLDLLFIRADGTIARITTGKPLSLDPLPAGEPVVAVLEIAGGGAAKLGIRAGARVRWHI